MDKTTLTNNALSDNDIEKLRAVLNDMGEFIAYFEVAERKMVEWKAEVDNRLQVSQALADEQLEKIYKATDNLREFMDAAGVARMRQLMDEVYHQGQEHIKELDTIGQQHLKAMESQHEIFTKLAKKSFDRLDRASNYVIKNISEAVGSFRIDEFRKLTDATRREIEVTTKSAVSSLKQLINWFNWKNLGLAAAITLVTSITMGLYLNDELPWEIHKNVAMERNAGAALINAWPNLSQQEQQRILEHSKNGVL